MGLRLVVATVLAAALPALAPGKEIETLMTVRGERIFADDFSGSSIAPRWKTIVGKWLLRDGALTAEHPTQQEHATIRTDLAFTDAVLQFDFKLASGGQLHVNVNDREHICRVIVDRQGFQLRKDGSKTDSSDAYKVLDRARAALEPDRWYTMQIEILGPEVVARVDQGAVAFGSDPKIARPKTSFGFPASGDSIFVDNVAVWRATASPGWPGARAKLQARQR